MPDQNIYTDIIKISIVEKNTKAVLRINMPDAENPVSLSVQDIYNEIFNPELNTRLIKS